MCLSTAFSVSSYSPSTARRWPAGSEARLCRSPLLSSSRTAFSSDRWSSGRRSPSPCRETHTIEKLQHFSFSVQLWLWFYVLVSSSINGESSRTVLVQRINPSVNINSPSTLAVGIPACASSTLKALRAREGRRAATGRSSDDTKPS